MTGEADERRELVARRIDFLELLAAEGPLETREAVDALEYSRSTVVRAFGELGDADLVTGTDEGYEVTVAGAMAAREYRRHERTTAAILDAQDLLEPIPESRAPPAEFLVDAEAIRADDGGPVRAFEALSGRVRDADAVRAYLPTLVDTHLLRAWYEGVVDRGADAAGVFDPDLLPSLKAQYPQLLSEMAAAGFSAVAGEGGGPPYALFLVERDGEATAAMVVYDGDAAVRGIVSNDGEQAVEWARETLDRLRAAGTDATAELDALGGAVVADGSPLAGVEARSATDAAGGTAGQSLPLALEAEGFVRLSPEYFERREPAPPAVSWRTGFTLPEVRAGRAVERTDGAGRPLTDRVVDRLGEGDAAVVGPPGSGKSTVCRSVACEWYETGRGPVLYRSDEGERFESTAMLEAYLRRTDGHALVVVEDCIREGADAVFDVVRSLADDDGVSFLLESQTDRWEGDVPGADSVDARVREAVERVAVPPLDEATCRRLAARFESLVDESVDVDGGELWSVVSDGADEPDRSECGDLLIAQHYLARRLDPVGDADGSATTALEADARRTYRAVADSGADLALELAGVAALLGAAGVPVAPAYLYGAAPGDALDAVEDALAVLEGRVLFDPERSLGRDPVYRTRHTVWSTAFLSAVVDETPAPPVADAVVECLDRLLSLAERPDRRERIAEALEGAAHLSRVDADPEGWLDSVAERVFQFGRDDASIARLYAGDPGIEVPETCSEGARVRCTFWRGQMLQQSGPLDEATATLERLESLAESSSLDAAATERWRVQARCALGTTESWRGNLERADEHLQVALRAARAIEDRSAVAEALLDLGNVDYWRGEYGAAREHYRDCLDAAREADDRVTVGRALTGLGAAAQEQGDLDAATEYQREALDVSVAAEDRSNEAEAAGHLGDLARERSDLDAAATWYRREYEVASDIGRGRSEADALRNLARVSLATEPAEAARDYARRAVDAARETGERAEIGRALALLAELGVTRTPVDAAERARAALDEFDAAGDEAGQSRCHRLLARSALERGAVEDADRHLERAAESATGDGEAAAACTAVRARVAAVRGESERARRLAEDALEALDHPTVSPARTDALLALARIRTDAGEADSGREALSAVAAERGIDAAVLSGERFETDAD